MCIYNTCLFIRLSDSAFLIDPWVIQHFYKLSLPIHEHGIDFYSSDHFKFLWIMICNFVYLYFISFGCTYLSLFIFVATHRVSPVVASRGYSSLQCIGFSLRWLFSFQNMGSLIVIHGLSYPTACGIFLDQGSNLRAQHWQAYSQLLDHQGGGPDLYFCMKPWFVFFN